MSPKTPVPPPPNHHTNMASLTERFPPFSRSRLVAELIAPPRFAAVTFDSYIIDPAQPSQAAAVEGLRAFASEVAAADPGRGPRIGRLFRRFAATNPRSISDASVKSGIYLDGGFGVGKTHLLAALWHGVPGPKVFGTFVELTNLVGALGFIGTVEALSTQRLLCIDEFELDDPGDTVLMSSLLDRLVHSGVRLAATSNTLPDRLGEGRFAAEDFLREIQGLASTFEVLRVDGADYRNRGLPRAPEPPSDAGVVSAVRAAPGATLDQFTSLCAHLAQVHPSRYGAMLDGVSLVGLQGIRAVSDQNVALRLVVLADRLYDRAVPVVTSGVPLDRLFTEELLMGGYRKKYRRAISRLTALAREAPTQ